MALGPPFLVRTGSIGDTMAEIRAWLDHRKIEPLSFRTAGPGGFEIAFRSEDEAHLFEREFRATGGPAGVYAVVRLDRVRIS